MVLPIISLGPSKSSLSWTTPVAQRWRICLQCRRHRFDPWVGKISWRRAWQLTPVFLLKRSHGQRSLVGYSPWSVKESEATEHNLVLITWYNTANISEEFNENLLIQQTWNSLGHLSSYSNVIKKDVIWTRPGFDPDYRSSWDSSPPPSELLHSKLFHSPSQRMDLSKGFLQRTWSNSQKETFEAQIIIFIEDITRVGQQLLQLPFSEESP